MVKINPKDPKWIITFKRKDERPNQTDDKFELFRKAVGLEDTKEILDLSYYTGSNMTEPITKTEETVTDFNLYINPVIIARLNNDQVARIRKDPNVKIVEPDGVAWVTAETPSWGNDAHTAPGAWSGGFRGSGVNVAVIDTGSDPTHVDLSKNTKVNQNFTTESNAIAQDSPHFHGTHCAGIIGAQQGNGVGVAGIAPDCNLWNLKAGNNQGALAFADIIEAAQYAVSNGAHVVSMSFATTQPTGAAFDTAVKDGYDNKNMLFFAAMGNEAVQRPIMHPAQVYGVNGISSLDSAFQLSTFTNWGPATDFCGAGTDILSTMNGNAYQLLSGTSMACPAVAAVAALGYSAWNANSCVNDPNASKNKQIEQAMIDSARQFQGAVGTKNEFYGYGFARATELCAKLRSIAALAVI